MAKTVEFDPRRTAWQNFQEWRVERPNPLVLVEDAPPNYVVHAANCVLIDGAKKIVCSDEASEALVEWCRNNKATRSSCATCVERKLRKDFLAFREECIRLRRYYNIAMKLFGNSNGNSDTLRKSAALFFRDVNDMLVDFCWLQACRITDGATALKTGGGRAESLTVSNLNWQLELTDRLKQPARDAARGLHAYRELVVLARHSRIAHADKQTIVYPASVPTVTHEMQEVHDFLDHVQTYCDEVGGAVGEGPLDFQVQAGEGDEVALLQHLRVGVYAKTKKVEPDDWHRIANAHADEY